jgi:hypothetical protein
MTMLISTSPYLVPHLDIYKHNILQRRVPLTAWGECRRWPMDLLQNCGRIQPSRQVIGAMRFWAQDSGVRRCSYAKMLCERTTSIRRHEATCRPLIYPDVESACDKPNKETENKRQAFSPAHAPLSPGRDSTVTNDKVRAFETW